MIPQQQLDRWMTPIWASQISYDESVVMVADSSGEAEASLLFEPIEIISVSNYSREVDYKEGQDWVYSGGKLRLCPGSDAPKMSQHELYPRTSGAHTQPRADNKGYLLFSEGHFFHRHQLIVTYTHQSGAWQGPIPQYQNKNLRRTLEILRNGESLKLMLYGDSIAEGYNASGFASGDKPECPYMPSWGELTAATLRSTYNSQVMFCNRSLAGQDSTWGVENVRNLVTTWRPDVTIIAFGMNDGTKRLPPHRFRDNIRFMMQDIRSTNPRAEFILVSPMLPNPESTFVGYQEQYRNALRELTGEGSAMVDLTSVHKHLLRRKSYLDLTGNHINHPNDYLIRWYAQQITGLLVANDP